MRRCLLGLLFLGLLQSASGQSIEVTEIYQLQVDGKAVEVEKGRPTEVMGVEGQVTVKVVSGPSLQVRCGQVRFALPAGLASEVDDDEETEYLTFDGNSVVVHLIRAKDDLDPMTWRDEVIEEITSGFEGAESGAEVTLATAEGKLEGRALKASLIGTVIRFEFYILPTQNDPLLMILQDTGDDEGRPSEEFGKIRSILAGSLSL